MNFAGQLETFLITIITGMVLGMMFDFYRIMRGVFRPRWLVTSVTDLLYWLLATAVVFVALLLGNWGEIRLYVFFGLFAGILCYFRLLSRSVIRLQIGVIRLAVKTVRTAVSILDHVLFRPVGFMLRLVVKPLALVRQRFFVEQAPAEKNIPPE
ncbi:MAG: spore cortex biosynthesis protein YabQ [Negativicutes bacterium]|nr:spore cortex biosynthesis protein YabQ [Negativicutes bacterium]